MTNRQLEIIMRLKDEVTKKLQGIEGGLRSFSQQVKEFSTHLKRMGMDLNRIGTEFIMLGALLTGPLVLAFNAAGRYSRSVSDEITRLKTVTTVFQLSVAQALVPIMNSLTNLLGRLYTAWESLGKAKQQVIIQTAFLTGTFMTLGGVMLKLIGGILKTTGIIISLVRGLTPVQWAVIAIVGAIALMIAHWEKVRQVVMPILNGIEIGANMVAIGFYKVIGGMVDGLIRLSLQWGDFLRILAQVPGPQQNVFLKAAEGMDILAGKMRVLSQTSRKTVDDLQTNIETVFSTGTGKLVDFVDNVKGNIDDIKRFLNQEGKFDFSGWEQKLKDLEMQTKTMGDVMRDVAGKTASAMAQSFSDGFYNVFTGQIKSVQDMFADFGRSVLKILSDVLAQLLISATLGRVWGSFNLLGLKFHQGGIVRAHGGYLASDEVPIIAQSGEGIISRKGMANLGAYNLQRLNRGNGVGTGGVTININPVIQAWDSRDVYRNRNMITGIVSDAIKSNTQLRKIIKDYA